MFYTAKEKVIATTYNFESDLVLDIKDMDQLTKLYGATRGSSQWDEKYDLNSDGIIDIFDLVNLSRLLGASYFEKNLLGNSFGNINNGGFVAEKDGYIYTSNIDQNNNYLYRMKLDGSDRKALNNHSSLSINVNDTNVFYINLRDSKIYTVGIGGGEAICINEEDTASSMVLYGGNIFYINSSDNSQIYRMKLDGSGRTKISEDVNCKYFNITEKFIYYVSTGSSGDSGPLYRMNVDGTEKLELSDKQCSYPMTDGQYIYYIDETDKSLWSIGFNGTDARKLSSDNCSYLNMRGDTLYYRNANDNDRLYAVKTDGSKRTAVNDIKSFFINIAGNYAYAQVAEENKQINKTFLVDVETVNVETMKVGSGSYASEPPLYVTDFEWWNNTTFSVNNFAKNTPLYIQNNDKPIPTNDWWTDLMMRQFGSRLWSYPQIVEFPNVDSATKICYGINIFYPNSFNSNGTDMIAYDPLTIKGENFNITKQTVIDWNDWAVTSRVSDNSGKYMDITMAHGMPITWFEVNGFDLKISLPLGAAFFDVNGQTVTFPYISDSIGVLYGGKYFGIHVPENTVFNWQSNNLSIKCGSDKSFLAVSLLPEKGDLEYYNSYASNIPRNTEVQWNYLPESGKVDVQWEVQTENLKGEAAGSTIQGFLPHHYKDALIVADLNNKNYITPRGIMKCAAGTNFNFSYDMNGIIPQFPAPYTDFSELNPYEAEKMNLLIDEVASRKTGYGGDTYWGGKDLLLLAKYALMAKQLNHPQFETLKQRVETALTDWLTYTSGEKERFFAYYPQWKGLIGVGHSYGSYQFTDNHFHYGYFIHAAALVAMFDKKFIVQYKDILTMIAKQYAGWNREDKDFPFMRTMDLWNGHSYAGGVSSPTGNNQESTSEAMQSWIGLYLLGNVFEDYGMRDAGAFGYVSESRATLEYWFDKDAQVLPENYNHDVVGILWNGGYVYGTYFSDNPVHIYGIQWLPVAPGFDYFNRLLDKNKAVILYSGLLKEIYNYGLNTAIPRLKISIAEKKARGESAYYDEMDLGNWEKWTYDGVITEGEVGGDWANVMLGFKQLYDPAYVTGKLNQYWNSSDRMEYDLVHGSNEAASTYFFAHANQNLGEVQWNYHMSIPTSKTYYNSKTGVYTYVVYNPKDTEEVCRVYKDGMAIGSINVPANTLLSHHLDQKLERLELTVPDNVKTVIPSTSLQFKLKGNDQYGASYPLSNVKWSVTGGGTIDSNGKFTAVNFADPVTVSAEVLGRKASYTFRVAEQPKLSSLVITPDNGKITLNDNQQFSLEAFDQYGDAFVFTDNPVWSLEGVGDIDENGLYTTEQAEGTATIYATLQGINTTAKLYVYPDLSNLAKGKKITASTEYGPNTVNKAVDGDVSTRWESVHRVDPQWISIDLEKTYDLRKVVIKWEAARAKEYSIEVSEDGENWKQVYFNNNGTGNTDTVSITASGRYVKIVGTKRTLDYGYSIFEFEVYGFPDH
jgi:endoglucanase Acf2